jgi:hypothetical protein
MVSPERTNQTVKDVVSGLIEVTSHDVVLLTEYDTGIVPPEAFDDGTLSERHQGLQQEVEREEEVHRRGEPFGEDWA